MSDLDLSAPQAEVVKAMRQGCTLKETRAGEFLLVHGNGATTKVLTNTVKALIRKRVLRDTKSVDRNGHKLYALEERS